MKASVILISSIFVAVSCSEAPPSDVESSANLPVQPSLNSNASAPTIQGEQDIFMASDAEFYGSGMEGLKRGSLEIMDGCVVMVSADKQTTYLALLPFGAELVTNADSEKYITVGTDKFNLSQIYTFTGGSVEKSLEGKGLFKTPIPKKCSRDAFSIGVIR